MWLIADSGSTKTEWILFDKSGVKSTIFSGGLNPLFLSKEEFSSEIENAISITDRSIITKLWFYSAGCGSEEVNAKTEFWLANLFEKASIQVESDLLAAARATCRTTAGLVAILGTGSNSCWFDGKSIKAHIKPLGFILGDEGSGAALGKALLKKLLRGGFSSSLSKDIFKEIGLGYDEIISKVYHEKRPNRFLASCAKILHAYKGEKEPRKIIEIEFGRFAEVVSMYDAKLPVHIIGSVGYYFKEEIGDAFKKNKIKLGTILKSPARALVEYHAHNT